MNASSPIGTVIRPGLAPVKGLRHVAAPAIVLDTDGVVGDRGVALVDPATLTTLKSVEHGRLVQVSGLVSAGIVRVELPDGTVAAQPLAGGHEETVAYWGRPVRARLVDGPVADALSRFVGRRVLLAPALGQGDFVWDAPVSVVLTSELDELARRLGRPDLRTELGRYRANLVVDGLDLSPGDRVTVGDAVLEIVGEIDRCAVMDHHPTTGESDAPVLATLAGYRRTADGILLGLKGRVVRPGVVRQRAEVRRLDPAAPLPAPVA